MADTMQRFKTLFAGSDVDYVECEVVNATQHYLQLREQGKHEGFTPVIVTLDDLILDEITEGLENAGVQTIPELVQRTMEASQAIDVPAFFAHVAQELPAETAKKNQRTSSVDDYFAPGFSASPDDDDPTTVDFISPFQADSDNPVIIIKLPTTAPYEALAYLCMGGWNDCPEPAIQVAISRYWYEKYSAVPAAISHDTVEYYVERPPQTDADAKAVAVELFYFSYGDAVYQGSETFEALANQVYSSRQWYVWWD